MICIARHISYCHQIKDDEMGGVYGMDGGHEKFMQGLPGKPETKRPLGTPKYRWKNNIKIGITEIG